MKLENQLPDIGLNSLVAERTLVTAVATGS